ncbi:diguanylate cyclase [Paracidovorax citrulli]|uniref:Diguanylate cyclase n=2 Tax=Paracidovorax citrulli TaxID=80869 RepID=A1TIP1_PARC0|nr:cache domain-containing protein [Paracidovorax citrulli]ABM30829.1 diguanylate cyclase [Paracidovorax citrulli AAC00-1]ATG95995.1 GGDEF domain-containing protein [Paracidovorax citrulli]MVT29762.1 diguanylate cyclase [Paracidovorax citrulli]MVT37822.1 diguanylate cyclase [Paracidovorax citrulli]PVY65002.1 diguanylate cyclase (GGDEF)-like protein [Paracidovorax citrulli]
MKRDFLPSDSTGRFLALLALTMIAAQVVAFVFLHFSNRRIAMNSVDAALEAGAQTFEYTAAMRRESRRVASELISRDYGLQNIIFNETNRDTVESALYNQLARTGAELIVLTDLDGTLRARSSVSGFLRERDAALDHRLELLVASVREASRNMRTMDGEDGKPVLHNWVKVTVRAPVPVAHIYLAFRITHAGAQQFARMTQLQMAFLSHDAEAHYIVHASTLPVSIPMDGIGRHAKDQRPFSASDPDGAGYRVKVITLDDSGPLPVSAVVAKPFAPVMSPFLKLEALFAFSVLMSAVISIVAVKVVASRVVTPLEDVAQKDALTGLANRRTFDARLLRAEQDLQRSGTGFAVMLMDLDKFKSVNDTYGHDAGDVVLKEAAARIQKIIRSSDTLARLGGDEFAILVRTDDPQTLSHIATAIVEVVRQPIPLQPGLAAEVGTSIGIAFAPAHSRRGAEVVHWADQAMYTAKRRGGGFAMAESAKSAAEASLDIASQR